MYIKWAEKHLGPIIRQQMEMEAEYGVDWPDKPVSALELGGNVAIAYAQPPRMIPSLGCWRKQKANSEECAI